LLLNVIIGAPSQHVCKARVALAVKSFDPCIAAIPQNTSDVIGIEVTLLVGHVDTADVVVDDALMVELD